VLVLVEELALWFGSSLLAQAYTPKTLLNIGAVLFVVVIALLLRQIREELKRSKL
jgi:protein-S-isoprenylcysteine O-methyltransferase Ste14